MQGPAAHAAARSRTGPGLPPELTSGGQLTGEASTEAMAARLPPAPSSPHVPTQTHRHVDAGTWGHTASSLCPVPVPGVRFRLALAPSRGDWRLSQSRHLLPRPGHLGAARD